MFTTATETPHWFPELDLHSTEEESVAQFRQRLNIADEAPEVTRYNNSDTPLYRFLTKYERETETLFTPRHFQYVDYLHAASSEDFGRTQTVYEKNFKVHLVHPGDFDDYRTYAYYDDSEVSYDYGVEHKVKKFIDPGLSSLELDWELRFLNVMKNRSVRMGPLEAFLLRHAV